MFKPQFLTSWFLALKSSLKTIKSNWSLIIVQPILSELRRDACFRLLDTLLYIAVPYDWYLWKNKDIF